MAQQVWLGLAGDLCSQDTPSDHYTTRIGGLPMFPGAAAPQWKGSTCPSCAVCGGPLPLVLQVWLPLRACCGCILNLLAALERFK
jgi:hypothetical protein